MLFRSSGDSDDEDFILTVSKEQAVRQLSAQYPTEKVMERSAVMQYFDKEENSKINQMWINVRCYNIANTPVWVWVLTVILVILGAALLIYRHFSINARN